MIKIIKKNWGKIVLIIVVIIMGVGIYKFFNPNINDVPTNEYINSLSSKNGRYILNSYKRL